MAGSKVITALSQVSVREELEIDEAAYDRGDRNAFFEICTVYTGAMDALIAAGVATTEQFPTGENGDRRWSKSDGCKGWRKNPAQRWKVLRHNRKGEFGIFDVYRFHEPRPIRWVGGLYRGFLSSGPNQGFERFMTKALNTKL